MIVHVYPVSDGLQGNSQIIYLAWLGFINCKKKKGFRIAIGQSYICTCENC